MTTKIEWVKNPDGTQGYTWNPITGCLNGCSYCYARKLANGRLKSRYLANNNLVGGYLLARGVLNSNVIPPNLDPFYPRFWDDKCYEIVPQVGEKKRKQRGIFVCDMSDLFGIGIPASWTSDVLDSIRRRPNWRFYLLTKQPQNLPREFPDNCWVGVSATNTEMFMKGCSDLEAVRAKVKYMSVEPLLDWDFNWNESYLINSLKRANINWVILGQVTPVKKATIPKIEWIKEIVEACDKAGIPVFEKNNLNDFIYGEYGGKYKQIFKYTQDGGRELRQEFPICH